MRMGWWLGGRDRRMYLSRPFRYVDVTFVGLYEPGEQWPFGLMAMRTADVDQIDSLKGVELMSKLIARMIREKKADADIQIVANDEWMRELAPTLHELLTTATKDAGRRYEPFTFF